MSELNTIIKLKYTTVRKEGGFTLSGQHRCAGVFYYLGDILTKVELDDGRVFGQLQEEENENKIME